MKIAKEECCFSKMKERTKNSMSGEPGQEAFEGDFVVRRMSGGKSTCESQVNCIMASD
jgi:hypothetical protein